MEMNKLTVKVLQPSNKKILEFMESIKSKFDKLNLFLKTNRNTYLMDITIVGKIDKQIRNYLSSKFPFHRLMDETDYETKY